MRDFISDLNSMKVIPNSIPKNAIPTPIPIQMMAISIPIPPGLGKANSNSIPIPELDLELARKSNSGAELTPTLVIHTKCITYKTRDCTMTVYKYALPQGNWEIPY